MTVDSINPKQSLQASDLSIVDLSIVIVTTGMTPLAANQSIAGILKRANCNGQADLSDDNGLTQPEIFIVDPDSIPFSKAVQAASGENILVVEGEYSAALDELISIAIRDSKSNIASGDDVVHVGFISHSCLTLWQCCLLKLYQGLVWLLLGVRKPSFKPGYVLFNRRQQSNLFGNYESRGSFSTSLANTEHLLALLRLQGNQFVEHETRLSPSSKSAPATSNLNFLKTKEIFKQGWQTVQFWWNEIRFPSNSQWLGGLIKGGENSAIQGANDPKVKTLFVHRLVGWFVLMVSSCVLLLGSLNYPLFEPDETRNAQIAFNIVESGNWLTLTLNDEPYRNKPPGLAWMIAMSYEWFGVSSWSTRLPNALITIITLTMVSGWGAKLVGHRASFLAALALLMSIGFMIVGRFVLMDAGFTCCIVGMSFSLILAEGTAWRWRKNLNASEQNFRNARALWLVAAGVFAGVGMMFKGPAIFVLALPPVFAAYALKKRLSFFWHPRVLLFILPGLMVGASWYLAMVYVDPAFLGDFLWRQNVMRFSNAFDHEAPFWFYFPVILVMLFPASYLLPALIKYLFARDAYTRGLRTPAQGYLVLMSVWVILFFSCSQSKLVTYVLPAIPFIALLMGAMLDGVLFAAPSGIQVDARRPSFWTLFKQMRLQILPFVSPLGFVLMSLLIVLVLKFGWDCPLPGSLSLWGVGWAVMFVIALVPWRFASNVRLNWICLGATGLGLMLTLMHVLIPSLAQLRSFNQRLVQSIQQAEYATAPIVFFDRHPYGTEMQIKDREIKYFKLEEAVEFRDYVAEHPLAVIVASEKNVKRYCKTLTSQVDLVKSDASKHIYFSHPRNQSAERARFNAPTTEQR